MTRAWRDRNDARVDALPTASAPRRRWSGGEPKTCVGISFSSERGRSVGIGGDVDVGDPSRRRRYVVDAKISGARAERGRGFAGPQGAFARLTRRGAGVSWALTCGGDADLGVEWGLDVKRRWRRKDGDGDGDGGGDGDGDGGGGKEKETPFVSISLRTSSRGGLENTKVYVQRGVE
jgi:hypothetical protein